MWAAIAWSLRLKERKHTFHAAGRPFRHDPAFGFAQRLGRAHSGILAPSARRIAFCVGHEDAARRLLVWRR